MALRVFFMGYTAQTSDLSGSHSLIFRHGHASYVRRVFQNLAVELLLTGCDLEVEKSTPTSFAQIAPRQGQRNVEFICEYS